jgi:peptidyl-prolyl cis-trans isomerase B (cyclophilin B)
MKRILSLTAAVILILSFLVSCGGETVAYEDIDFSKVALDRISETDQKTDYVIITVRDFGRIVVRLYPDVAPKTVKNFKKLVAEGFYDGTVFHRVIEGFMIQGGGANDPSDTPPSIKGEFNNNGFKNNLKHTRGVVSMAKVPGNNNSASSQFFICQDEYSYGDGDYASFGFVVNGMNVVDAIAAVGVNASNRPLTPVVIESIRFASVK